MISTGAKKKKRTRGPTCMPKVWALYKPVNVSFNGLGQPNDKKRTSTLAHFVGTNARNGKYCPLSYKYWRLMPDDPYKNDMLKEVKFDLPPRSDGYVLKSINHKWRNWKCQLKNLNFDTNVPIEEQLLEVPERQVSEKNKESCAKLEILHRMGKTSYAVVSEIMKDHMGRYPTRAKLFEKWCYPSDGSPMSEAVLEAIEKMKEVATQNDENSIDCDMVHDTDDAFGKIMGNDKDGRVRMYGMGVKPTDIYGGKPSCDALFRKSMEEKEEMRAMKEKLEEVTALVHNRTRSGGQSEVERATFSSPNNWSSSQPVSRPIRVGAYVKLKSLGNLNEVVAIGIVKEIGCVRANGRDLGPVICEIVVQSTLKNDEMLIYPHDHIQTIGDSLGAPVAWSLSLFALDEDEN